LDTNLKPNRRGRESLPPPSSRAISRFSFFATVLVVMCHVDDVMIPVGHASFFVRWLGGSFSSANVCNFFFLSGFLLARHFRETGWYRRALVSRMYSLGIPYVLWCATYAAFAMLKTGAWAGGGLRDAFGIGLLAMPNPTVMWYLKTLMYFVILSPILFPLAADKRLFPPSIALSLLFYCAGKALNWPVMPYFGFCFHLLGFTAFLCGAHCSIHGHGFRPWSKCMKPVFPLAVWIAVSLVAMQLSTRFPGTAPLVAPVNIAASVFCLVWLATALKWNVPSCLARCSFFVFALHPLVLRVVSRLPSWPNPSVFPCGLEFAGILFVAVSVPIALANALHFACPGLANLLSGGRMDGPVRSGRARQA
jgi:peptidoglycan/LPS O-acetylase OafA/YrhL